MGPDWATWRVLWAFKVSTSLLFPWNRFPPGQSKACKIETPTCQLFSFFHHHRHCFALVLFWNTTLVLSSQHASQPRYYRSSGYFLPSVTSTNGASPCVPVSFHPRILWHQEPRQAEAQGERCNFSYSSILSCLLCCLLLVVPCITITRNVLGVGVGGPRSRWGNELACQQQHR